MSTTKYNFKFSSGHFLIPFLIYNSMHIYLNKPLHQSMLIIYLVDPNNK